MNGCQGPRTIWLPALLWLVVLSGCGGTAPASLSLPAPAGSELPHLTRTAAGKPLVSWVEPAPAGHRLAFAELERSGWSAPRIAAEGAGWFVNWADVPSVAPLHDDLWAAHWLVQRPGGMYAYDIAMSISVDGGVTWRQPFRPHDDDTQTEHGFVSLWPARGPDGSPAVGALWLDGRHMLLDPSSSADHQPRMALRGATFDDAGTTLHSAEVDGQVCECCRTAVAVPTGGPAVAYRDRTADEQRDIAIATLSDGAWRREGLVALDGWRITGCPVNGPALAARSDALAVAWFSDGHHDRRVRVARRRGDASWSAAVDVSRDTLGRVDVTWLDDDDLAVSWMAEAAEDRADILVARVDRAGHVGRPLRVATTAATRPAGFPRLLRHGDELLVAWTRWQQGQPRVVVSHLATAELETTR